MNGKELKEKYPNIYTLAGYIHSLGWNDEQLNLFLALACTALADKSKEEAERRVSV